MKVFWFGDSWCAGSELVHTTSEYEGQLGDRLLSVEKGSEFYDFYFVQRYRPDLAFPALITRDLNLDSYYYVKGGSSIYRFYSYLLDAIRRFDVSNSIAVFSLPTSMKRFEYISNDGEHVWKNKPGLPKEIPNLMERVQIERGHYDITLLLNLIYNTCIVHGITPYFFACWTKIEIVESFNDVPEENFYFPLSTTLVDLSWDCKNIEKVNNPDIAPNIGRHPNLGGQKKLADTLKPYIKKSLLL